MEEMNQRVSEFVVNDIWKIIDSKDSSKEKLQKVIEAIAEFFNVEKCSLMLKQEGEEDFCIVAARGLSGKVVECTKIKEGEGISGMAIKERVAIFMKKISLDKERYSDRYRTDSFISYPIEDEGKIIGVLNLTDKKDIYLSEQDLEAIAPIIERIKFVIERLE